MNFVVQSLSSVQFSSVAQSCLTLCDPMNRSTPGLPVHHKLPEFTQTHAHRVSDAIQPSHPLSSPSPPAPIPPSIRVFSIESILRKRWPEYWSFSFSISPSNEHPVMSNSLWPHVLQHARLPCPSLSPWVCSKPCLLGQWCHPTISFSITSFSSCPQSFPSIGASASAWMSGGRLLVPVNVLEWSGDNTY